MSIPTAPISIKLVCVHRAPIPRCVWVISRCPGCCDNALLSQKPPQTPDSALAGLSAVAAPGCPRAALPRDADALMSAFEMSLLGVTRLAVLPGSRHSNPLFHFSGLSFWHSEKHHLKLIKAPYFVPNLAATNSVYYVLCRVGGTSLQGTLGCATKTHGWGDICRVNRMLTAFPQITAFAQITGLLWWNHMSHCKARQTSWQRLLMEIYSIIFTTPYNIIKFYLWHIPSVIKNSLQQISTK